MTDCPRCAACAVSGTDGGAQPVPHLPPLRATARGCTARSPLRGRLAAILLALASVSGASVLSAAADAGEWRPWPVDPSRAATTRRLAKPVQASRLLDDMESTNHWSVFGPGEMQFTAERRDDGEQSIRLTSPTRLDRPGPVSGRPFGETGLRRAFDREDWTAFNRLSFRVYPTLPGFRVISLLVKFRAEGSDRWSYTHGALHYVLLEADRWNHVVWEIPHLERTNVTAVEFIYRLQGHEPEATNRVCFDFDRLELQRVEPDPFLGWDVAPGRLAYNHLGYRPAEPKRAWSSGPALAEFEVVGAADGARVYAAAPRRVVTPQGEFLELDFSAVRAPGRYRLRAGGVESAAFAIGDAVWVETAWATLNLFRAQRCGDRVPGIHGVCHRDWQGAHGDRRMIINGGWHDAGDLSQGLVNTAEAAEAMLRLAARLPADQADLGAALRREAGWGLDWILKTRFGDGARVTWATMDFWTDGILGNADDVTARATDGPYDNFIAATVCALAGRELRDVDPVLAAYALRTAAADWEFAVAKLANPGVELAAAGARASLELFRATREDRYAARAVEFADLIVRCQETRAADWALPLRGFFYTHPDQRRLLHYNHRSHEQAPVVALADLCAVLPGHADWMKWYAAVALHSEYLRAAATASAPYEMLAAGVYRLSDAREAIDRAQVVEGLKLDAEHYLRRFPVWRDFRGNLGVQLTQAKALATAAHLRHRASLGDLARRQLDWTLGANPFAQSLMFGVGHDYAPQYTAMSGDIVGSLPVGIQSRAAEDRPYWPASNCYNYSELWVHPSSRWLALLEDLWDGLPGTAAGAGRRFQVHAEGATPGGVRVRVTATDPGRCTFEVRATNLTFAVPRQALEVAAGISGTVEFVGTIVEPTAPWLAVVAADGDWGAGQEVSSFAP